MKKPALQQAPEYALSIEKGEGRHPKDFDWMAINVPCRSACPADTDIPGYLEAIYQGNPEAAYRINLRDNIFPAVLGRTCTRPCEPACRHGRDGLGDPVAICFAKRSAE
jgi:NADPH-dependent glutamate synthase beta subunit-like oxidoreductase